MSSYRRLFPNKTIPKQHILEKHCVTWVQNYGFGMALHGEQGGELIHASVAKIERRGLAIKNVQTQLKFILKTQHLQTTPDLMAYTPKIKKRKNK